MALSYQNRSIKDLGGGIDQKSAPNAIPDTFAEDLQNVITNSNGLLAKRPGYQGYYGFLPLRVKSINHQGTTITFTLDDSINTSSLDSSPIVVQGKLSSTQTGDWTSTDNTVYYETYSSNVRTILEVGSQGLIPETSHGVNNSNAFVTVLDNSANTSSLDWSLIFPDVTSIEDASPFDVNIEHAFLPYDLTTFVGISDKSTVSASSYTTDDTNLIDSQTATITIASPAVVTVTGHGLSDNDPIQFSTTGDLPTGITAGTTYYVNAINANTFNIAASAGGADINTSGTQSGTHTISAGDIIITSSDTNFTNSNILVQVLEYDSGLTNYARIFPDISVNNSTGTVTIVFNNSGSAPMRVKALLSQAEASDFKTTQVGSGSPGGTDVTTIMTGMTDDGYDVQVYENNAGILTWVMPESVTKNADNDTLSVQLINSGSSKTYYIFYESISFSTTAITVEDTTGSGPSYTDTAPQITLWGIPHENIYSTSDAAEGHVTHIDSYKKDTESRIVTGLGGNLFTARTREEEGTDFKIPTTNVNITEVVAVDKNLAPCFDVTGSTTSRTRGLITSDEVENAAALITDVAYVSPEVAIYTLSLTNKSGDLSTAIDTSATTPDKLTVTGMAHSVHNGTFTITAVDNSANTITVSNPLLKLSDFDESGARGRAAINTDQVTLNGNSPFLSGDTFITNIATTEPTVSTSSGTTVVLSGITSSITIPNNLSVYGTRSGQVIPVDSTDNFVKGDMCSFGDILRQVRVVGINPSSDITLSNITGDGAVATVTTATDHGLSSGQSIVLLRTGVDAYNGEQRIVSITSSTEFTISSTSTSTTSAGVILGKTIEIDESLTITDNTSNTALSVIGRWIPVEAPSTSDDLPAKTYVNHLDAKSYKDQDTLRSVMVSDNMYFTNQQDEVMKFDGTNIYQAGLFRWQPQLFTQLDTTTASIPLTGTSGSVSAVAANKFTVGTGEATQFNTGDTIAHSADAAVYIVQSVDVTNDLVYTTTTITGAASGTIKIADRFKYYFRLNAIDSNNNIISSASTGADDFSVDLTASGQIKMRLIGMPVWGNYDYDKLELEVYRTKAGTSAPFFRVAVKDMSFNSGDGYIDFVDGVTDDTLGTKDLDSVNTNLKGAELGTAWTQPLRAEYITSSDNRLILANIKDYPELDIVIRGDEGVGSVTAANMAGKIITFRKDDTNSSTTTDMTNVARYEFVNSGAVTITPNTDIANNSSTFTVTSTAHGLAAGDWVYMYHAATGNVNSLTYAGWWQIASVNTNDFTINANMNTAASANDVDSYVAATTTTDIPVWLGTDGNMNQIGANTINEFTAMIRLANSINASMRMTDTALDSAFTPWMVANAGSEFNAGQLVVRQEKVESSTMEVVLPNAITGASYYIKGLIKSASDEVSATSKLFTSRVLLSYPNFPEIFDNPFGDQSSSDSVIDVNSADGQDITGIIPFFGDAVFGGGQVEDILVIFKTNSIYLLNTTTRDLSKIQSRGLGCTAPFSIAQTRDGIMFANNSGIYRLNRNQSISYVGKNMERLYRDDVNRDQLSKMQGHHYGIGGQYKLSVPFGSTQTTNNRVFVYDHQREGIESEFGAWAQFTNHNATGWANLNNDAFFSTTDGQVFSIRRVGDETDYRDDASAVDTMTIVLKAEDFGNGGARKVVNSIISHFHVRKSSMLGTELLSSVDLDGDFVSAGDFTFTKEGNDKVKTVRSSLSKRKLVYIQLKYINNTKDEDVILTGVDFRVALVTDKGIQESSESS